MLISLLLYFHQNSFKKFLPKSSYIDFFPRFNCLLHLAIIIIFLVYNSQKAHDFFFVFERAHYWREIIFYPWVGYTQHKSSYIQYLCTILYIMYSCRIVGTYILYIYFYNYTRWCPYSDKAAQLLFGTKTFPVSPVLFQLKSIPSLII